MSITLPRKCFISHAYADAAVRNRLIASLPDYVQAYVYPPITVGPELIVSNPLIEALLDCDGIIYLNGGYSEQSFWVAFERDYALRSGKKVFSANPVTMEITPHLGSALDLAVFASYHRKEAPRVREIANFLEHERYFDLWLDEEDLSVGANWAQEIEQSLEDRLKRGGYVIVFWSTLASESAFIKAEVERAARGISDINDRVLFALLEDVPLPEFWLQYQEPGVQLYGDAERPTVQRLDDLVARLYWLIYRKTRHCHLDKSDV